MPEDGPRSPSALVGVIAAHIALAWGLTQLVLHPERLPEPIVIALLPDALPEPDVQPQPLPQADVAPVVRRAVSPRPVPVRQETVVPPPRPEIAEPTPAPPLPAPLVQPAPLPVPQPLERETLPMPELAPAADPAPLPPAPAQVAQVPAEPAPADPAPAAAEDAPVTQPLFAADYLRNPKPRYPMISRRMGEEGLVKLRVYVTSAGEPRQVELKESCGFPRLDQAALNVVKNWRFVPARRGEAPVDAWVVVPIRFTLKG